MKDHDSDSFTTGQKSKLDIVGPNHLRIQTVRIQSTSDHSAGDGAPFIHTYNDTIPRYEPHNSYMGEFLPTCSDGQRRIAEYLDLAKNKFYNQKISRDIKGPRRDNMHRKHVKGFGNMSRGSNDVICGIPISHQNDSYKTIQIQVRNHDFSAHETKICTISNHNSSCDRARNKNDFEP